MKNEELLKDIFAYALILLRFGYHELLENKNLFVETLNISGFRTVAGKQFTQQSFTNLVNRVPDAKEKLYNEFADVIEYLNYRGSRYAPLECIYNI